MGKVTTGFSVSLDGFVAGPNDSPENALGDGGDRLFKWYFSGDDKKEVPSGNGTFKMAREAAEMVEQASQSAGVLVTARRTFDIAGAWGGKHPMDVPIVVVTHRVICKVLVLHLMNIPNEHFWKIRYDPAGISLVVSQKGIYVVSFINDTCHLKGGQAERQYRDF